MRTRFQAKGCSVSHFVVLWPNGEKCFLSARDIFLLQIPRVATEKKQTKIIANLACNSYNTYMALDDQQQRQASRKDKLNLQKSLLPGPALMTSSPSANICFIYEVFFSLFFVSVCFRPRGNKGGTHLIGRHIGFVENIHLNPHARQVTKILPTDQTTKYA